MKESPSGKVHNAKRRSRDPMATTALSVNLASSSAITGQIERVTGNEAVGWVFNSSRPEESVSVGIRVGHSVVGTGVADIVRTDLRRAGFGRGRHGFRIPLDIQFVSGQSVVLDLFDNDSNESVAAVPFTLHYRDPKALGSDELDDRSAHGLVPVRKSKNRRRLDAAVSPVLKPIRRIKKRFAASAEGQIPPGTKAKLARVDDLSLVTPANVDNWPELTLPEYDTLKPEKSVSVIIPVYNQFQLTYQCLTSLILSGDAANIEIIVVDDASSDATQLIESKVNNLKVIRNENNLGFLHSCNKAAAAALGKYIIFLNNDTEVESGWIDNMLDVFERFSDTGAVGAKLIYPDGTLQDAGGIVWESGTPWNVGHGKDRDDPEYNYVREVDYLTGAALMVLREAWDVVGGFSESYAPAYYEDTDIAFKLRKAGYRTRYCPQATVVHYEGRSNGTDTGSGVKQHQLVNAETFKTTWCEQFVGQGTEGVDLRRQKDRNRGLRVLVVDNSFPRLGQDAGSYAAIQEIKLLLALGCKVTFLPNNLLHLGKHVDFLQSMGVECVHAPFHRSVPKFLERRAAEFDSVYVTRYVVAESIIPLVRQFSDAKIIFNNADLHFLREARTAWASGQADLSSVDTTRRRELNVMKLVDIVLSYSDVELEIISSHLLDRSKLFRCPWVLNTESEGGSYTQREGLAFLGGYAHPPNKAAMDWFIKNVMPDLHRKRPTLKLHVWGSHLPADCDWKNQAGVVLEGYAETLDNVFTGALAFIAPLQAGAGIKGKVLDSLAYGVPTVLSPVAAEATGLVDGESTLIAQSPEQWIEHIERLLDNQELWQRIRDNSLRLKDSRYSQSAGIVAMQNVFDYLGLDTTVSGQQVTVR